MGKVGKAKGTEIRMWLLTAGERLHTAQRGGCWVVDMLQVLMELMVTELYAFVHTDMRAGDDKRTREDIGGSGHALYDTQWWRHGTASLSKPTTQE